MARGWPVRLQEGSVGVRPLARSDARRWAQLRVENRDWLTPWDATLPPGEGTAPTSHAVLIGVLRRRAKDGTAMPFAVTWDGVMVGQVTVNSITRGSALSASIGYWVARSHAGRGITPTAVALVTDHLLTTVGLHRVEIAIRPENTASLRVVEKLGFTEVGLSAGYLHIDGDWRDHLLFQVTREQIPRGLVARLREVPGPTA